MAAMDVDDDGMDVEGLNTLAADELDERKDAGLSTSLRAEQAAALEILDARARGRKLALPTDDAKVRQRLRNEGEPITLFGERPPDRRERLREFLVKQQQKRAQQGESDGGDAIESEDSEDEEEEEQEEEFYTEGSQDLLSARQDIARFSLRRAAARIQHQKRQTSIPLQKIINTRKEIFAPLRTFTNLGSQIGGTRFISIVRFSPNGQILATGCWSGGVKLWDIPSARERKTMRGHSDKVGGLSWHPEATLTQSETAVNMATGAADGNIKLWSLADDRPITTLSGHAARVARVEFHPCGAYIASASYDGTWRLWDVNRAQELLIQEGHSKEVYSVAFQGDGALLASGGLDAIGRVWDLRTGRTAMILDGHAREILSIDFSSNGYTLATASGDDTVRVWDLRQAKQTYTIPAHKSSCTDVRFFKSRNERLSIPSGSNVIDGGDIDIKDEDDESNCEISLPHSSSFLVTGGYDGYVKIWSADDWQILRSMHADNKIMSVDVHPDGDMLASGDWGRTFKLWGSL